MKSRSELIRMTAYCLVGMAILWLLAQVITHFVPAERNSIQVLHGGVPRWIGFADAAILLTSGLAIMQRRKWGRSLYVLWSGPLLIVHVWLVPNKLPLIPGAIVLLLVSTVLFLPSSSRYLSRT